MTENSGDLFGSISIADDQKPVKPQKEDAAKPRKAPRSSKSRQKRSYGGTLKFFLLLLVLVGCYALVGFTLVPYLAKNNLPDYLREKLNINTSITEAQFNPFNFRLNLQGLSLETNEMGEPQARFLSIADITIDLDFLSLLRGDFVCSSMDIEQLYGKITRDKNKRYNISYLFKNSRKRNESGIIDFAELPFLFSLNNIKISDSQIIFDDKNSQKTHRIEEIQLALPAISNFPYQSDSYIHPRFSAVINGSPIKLTGEASLSGTADDGRQTQLSCDLNDIDIPLYFDYLPLSLPIDVNQGRANGKLHISFSPDQERGSKLKIGFSLATSELAFESRNSKLSLRVPSAKFEGSLEPFNQSLTIQSIILREPTLSSDGIITRETVSNLIPLTLRPGTEDPLHKVIPAISTKLLIADGGSVIIKKNGDKKPIRIWHSIQLSIKNFTNDRITPSKNENSFRLSGEHLSSSAFFTWQGQLDSQNRPGGNLQLNNVDAATIAPFLGRSSKDVEGIADVSGLLSISLNQNGENPFDYTLKSTRVTVRNLKLKENDLVWLTVPSLRCDPVSRINGITDLGNVFLKNSTVSLEGTNLPSLFQRFSKKPAQHVIHGIDFSGTINITDKEQGIEKMILTDTLLQANRLEQQQANEENFVLSATLNKAGSIKAKGNLRITPFQVSTEVAFSGLSPSELFSWFTRNPTFRKNHAVLSGRGMYKYPQKEYKGSLAAKDIAIGEKANPQLKASQARFDKLNWSGTAQQLSINYILVEKPSFSWGRYDNQNNPLIPLSLFLRTLFLPGQITPETSANNAAKLDNLNINQIDFNNGTIRYQDQRIQPPLSLDITSINGSLNNLVFPYGKESSTFALTGNLENNPFKAEGSGWFIQASPSAEITFSSQNLPVSIFGKQTAVKLGEVDPARGRVNITSTARIEENYSSLSATLELFNLRPKQSETPTALALALLTEPGDMISLSINNEGKNQTILLTEALSSIGTSIIKTSIDPMLLADDEFKDLIDTKFLMFPPGSSKLSEETITRLNRFNEFLGAHPLIRLVITGYVDRVEDYTAIYTELEDLERRQTEQTNQALQEKWEAEVRAQEELIEQQLAAQNSDIKETDIPVNTIPEFVPVTPKPVEVTDSMLRVLAVEREKSVINYLVEKLAIPEDRIEQAHQGVNRIRDNAEFSRVDIRVSDLFAAVKAPGT